MRVYRFLVAALVAGVNAVLFRAPPVPTVIKFNLHPWTKRTYGKAIAGGSSVLDRWVGAALRLVLGLFTPRRLALLACLLALATIPDMADGAALGVFGFAGETAVLPPKTLDQKRARLEVATEEMGATQRKYAGEIMPADVATTFEALCEEIKGYQDELDEEFKRQGRASDLQRWAGVIPHPTMPAEPDQLKARNRISGYMTLGEYVINCKGVADGIRNGTLAQMPARVDLGGGLLSLQRFEGKNWVEVSEDEVKAFGAAWESKAVPTIGAGVVEPTRLPGITQVQQDLPRNVRLLFPASTTSSDQVEYVRRSTTTRAAAETAHGGAKPEAAMGFDLVTGPVRTIAAHMPVQLQQLADWGQLQSEIDNFLLYDLASRVEEQLIYGAGTGVLLEGLTVVAGTGDISANGRYVGSIHTLIDVIRMGMTDTVVSGYTPTAALIHPLDWETVQLEKGTDNRYVWVVVTDDNGSRIWGLRVVESHGAQANRGSATEERNIIVGDYQRGATVSNRQDANIQVGTINAQFTSNLRTVLAEERLAFPIRVPGAFNIFQTQADVP